MRLKLFDRQVDSFGAWDHYQMVNDSRVSSSRAMWRNLRDSSSIEWTRVNHNDSHLSVSLEPLIEDEITNPTVTPKFVYLYECSLTENVFLDVFEYSNCLDTIILESLAFFFFFKIHFPIHGVVESEISSKE